MRSRASAFTDVNATTDLVQRAAAAAAAGCDVVVVRDEVVEAAAAVVVIATADNATTAAAAAADTLLFRRPSDRRTDSAAAAADNDRIRHRPQSREYAMISVSYGRRYVFRKSDGLPPTYLLVGEQRFFVFFAGRWRRDNKRAILLPPVANICRLWPVGFIHCSHKRDRPPVNYPYSGVSYYYLD